MTRRTHLLVVVAAAGVAGALIASVATEPRAIADAPPCRYTLPGDGTVIDNETGLTWQQSATTGNMTQPSAMSFCQNLQLAGGGWRISTIEELHTLVDVTRTAPALDPTAFPDSFVVSPIWSGTSKAGTAGAEGWAMMPASGTIFTLQSNFAGGPRCVR